MERSKNITNITSILLLSLGLLASTTLLAVALFASPAEAKPASVLLQEGLYAEEIEGDLDAAIKIYKQVVAEVKAAQQIAAQATYRLGMCYLKKGREEKAAEYFRQVVSNYPERKALIKRANKQLVKIAPDITPKDRPYIVWFKPTDSNKVTNAKELLDIFNASHPKNTMTFRYRTEEKDGQLIGRICVDNGTGKDKIVKMLKESADLELIKAQRVYTIVFKPADSKLVDKKTLLDMFNADHPQNASTYYYRTTYRDDSILGYISTDTKAEKDTLVNMINNNNQLELVDVILPGKAKGNLFEILGGNLCSYIGSKYGEVCAEAGMKKLYANCIIYLVDNQFVLRGGGMGYVYNYTDRPITERYRISGTRLPTMKFYDSFGEPIDVEITPDEQRTGFFHIYWNPKEPLGPGEFFNYASAVEGSLPLSQTKQGYHLTMDNRFGDHCYETFFLVVPEGTTIVSQSEEYTKMKNFEDWDIYWWKKEVQQDENHIVTLSLQKVPQYTQQMHNEIDPNGLIHFTNPHNYTNAGTEVMTNTSFINSDFVNVVAMYYKNGQPVKYTTTHEGNHFRYNITFDKPILPGETIEGTVEGTITGLIKPVASMPDTYQYYMNHSPSTNMPTLRIETYLLPKGAEIISISPGMKKTEKNGRIELTVEKIIPVGGSLLTTFQYRLGGAKLASAEPLKLERAPWVDGEVMEVRLKRPAGNEYGTIIYSAQKNISDEKETWRIMSHMHVTTGNVQQYTLVEAKVESFVPVYGQTTNWMGDFVAEYNNGNVKLTVDTKGKESTRDVSVQGIAYDNEQALYLIRRMPLAENYEGSFPIFSVQGGVTIECRIKVVDTEDITVEAGTFTCYKTDLSIYMGEVKTLQHTLWFSADEHKYLVKYDVGGTATMELAKVWQKDKDKPITFENKEPAFSVTMPADWRFYSYGTGPQFSLQLISPELKAWTVLVWQKRGTDPDSASAMTIAKADFQKMKGFFENYIADQTSWKEFEISGLKAAQYIATYQKKGSGLRTYTKPQAMVEYRTYIVDESDVYWFVFRIDKDKFEKNRSELDSIVESFKHIE